MFWFWKRFFRRLYPKVKNFTCTSLREGCKKTPSYGAFLRKIGNNLESLHKILEFQSSSGSIFSQISAKIFKKRVPRLVHFLYQSGTPLRSSNYPGWKDCQKKIENVSKRVPSGRIIWNSREWVISTFIPFILFSMKILRTQACGSLSERVSESWSPLQSSSSWFVYAKIVEKMHEGII